MILDNIIQAKIEGKRGWERSRRTFFDQIKEEEDVVQRGKNTSVGPPNLEITNSIENSSALTARIHLIHFRPKYGYFGRSNQIYEKVREYVHYYNHHWLFSVRWIRSAEF